MYILHLRRGTEANLRRASDQSPVATQQTGTGATVKLTIAYDDDGVFRSQEVSTIVPADPSDRARAILETLLSEYVSRPSPHPLAQGSAVDNVFFVSPKFAVVDLNQAMADAHRSGIMVEDFTIMSLIDTLSTNFPTLERVKLLVDGKERETLAGHADLSAVYSTAAVHRLVMQLQ
jgi:hypothetical protein